ncbi:MAG: hypothetical protein A2912_06210 [Candidatus Buchananbacteria bacterium RIFCSPLOWO2_01_FULL_40_23b]|uniref:Methyltransferase type 11 domain-containing protein n=1 Tax=Candidatus Buchananbacteria bacterium RIFCSPLOWO2_01_FULL_40_23b TaxID=1797544 RepID=A0A1G1YTJ5_9BACT|nr:MAG: hypothetical protein A2912_06210 [Candidatus Buchananbacteria bacterium RIFCSPLOWO2_01_FULL_40_23b]
MVNKKWEETDVDCYSQYDASELQILHPQLLQIMGNISGKRIADYGCGEGKFLPELHSNGAQVYGYDISEAMIAQSRKRVGNKAELKVIESGKIPLQDNTIDIVVSNLVLMMCPSTQVIKDIFSEVYKVLVPNGQWTFCITHPAFSDRECTTFRNVFDGHRDYFQQAQPYQFVLKKNDGTEITTDSFRDYHYPLSTYLNLLPQTGFRLERVEEVFVEGNSFPPYFIAKSSAIK